MNGHRNPSWRNSAITSEVFRAVDRSNDGCRPKHTLDTRLAVEPDIMTTAVIGRQSYDVLQSGPSDSTPARPATRSCSGLGFSLHAF
jgi:hypothetical protein